MATKYLHHDWETFSECNIKKAGAHRYCADKSTEPMSLAYGDSAILWLPGDPMPANFDWRNTTNVYTAFNAEFEWCVWNYVIIVSLAG